MIEPLPPYAHGSTWDSMKPEAIEAMICEAAARGDFDTVPPRHKPSREFMVQQATLNALAQHMPAATRLDGAPSAMRHLVAVCGWEHGQPSAWFCRSVRDHFAVIEAQYHD